MPRPQSPATIVRLLRDLSSRAEDSDYTSLAQDRAIIAAIAIVKRNEKLEALRYEVAKCSKDGECRNCYQDGFDTNTDCKMHAPFDMPGDDAVETLNLLIETARKVGLA